MSCTRVAQYLVLNSTLEGNMHIFNTFIQGNTLAILCLGGRGGFKINSLDSTDCFQFSTFELAASSNEVAMTRRERGTYPIFSILQNFKNLGLSKQINEIVLGQQPELPLRDVWYTLEGVSPNWLILDFDTLLTAGGFHLNQNYNLRLHHNFRTYLSQIQESVGNHEWLFPFLLDGWQLSSLPRNSFSQKLHFIILFFLLLPSPTIEMCCFQLGFINCWDIGNKQVPHKFRNTSGAYQFLGAAPFEIHWLQWKKKSMHSIQ